MQEHTKRLAEYVVETKFQDLPPKVVDKVKMCILDYLGCALFGHTTIPGKIVVECVKQLGGTKEATVIGEKQKTSCMNAALANGVMGHSFELDDTYKEALMHPGSAVIPSALALAERELSNGEDFILAVALGYELACRVGASVCPSQYELGWHPTGTNCVFGSAAAAGKILKLDYDALSHALSLAGTQASGLIEAAYPYFGKHFHAGKAALNGVLAALLAKGGFTGGYTILEGKRGYCQAMSKEPNLDRLTNGLGQSHELLKIYFKRHASAADTHAAIDAALILVQKHKIEAKDIEKVNVKAFRLLPTHFSNYDPKTILAAQLSTQYCVAVALIDGKVGPKQFTASKLNDSTVRGLMRKTVLETDSELDKLFPRYYAARVEIQTKDGKVFAETVKCPRGDPENPLTEKELQEKFGQLATTILTNDQANEIVKVVYNLEKIGNLSELVELL